MFVRRKDYEEVCRKAIELTEHLDRLRNQTLLIDIQRDGRLNKFTFMRGDKVEVVETMGLISDDVGGWKRRLLP